MYIFIKTLFKRSTSLPRLHYVEITEGVVGYGVTVEEKLYFHTAAQATQCVTVFNAAHQSDVKSYWLRATYYPPLPKKIRNESMRNLVIERIAELWVDGVTEFDLDLKLSELHRLSNAELLEALEELIELR
jgi:hypothetical protein